METKISQSKRDSLRYLLFIGFLLISLSLSLSAYAASSVLEEKQKFEAAKNLIHTYSGKGDNYERALKLAEDIFWDNSESPYSYLIVAELKSKEI